MPRLEENLDAKLLGARVRLWFKILATASSRTTAGGGADYEQVLALTGIQISGDLGPSVLWDRSFL